MQIGVWISLTLYFVLMLAIGFYAWRKSTSNVEEYVLGGRNLNPAVAALSAGASDMSGWLLLGLPGALYAAGLVEAWIGIGLTVGALLNWIIVAPRLREQTERYDNSLTIPEFLANRFPSQAIALRMVSAVVIVVFFSVYTASGLVAGGKLFSSAFAGAYQTGVWLTLGIVLAYTVVGGFLAVCLTDFVQGCIMMLALILMPLVVLYGPGGGGIAQSEVTLAAASPDFLSLTAGLSFVGFLSAVTWGLGYFGQPHIIVRFMAVRSVAAVSTARNIGMTWMVISLLGAIGLGVFGRAYVIRSGITIEDPETIFIVLAELLFHPLVTGFLFAALLAAIMSTVSSQLLVSSTSLTEDFYRLFLHRDAGDHTVGGDGRASGGGRRRRRRGADRRQPGLAGARSRRQCLGGLRRGLRPAHDPVPDMVADDRGRCRGRAGRRRGHGDHLDLARAEPQLPRRSRPVRDHSGLRRRLPRHRPRESRDGARRRVPYQLSMR